MNRVKEGLYPFAEKMLVHLLGNTKRNPDTKETPGSDTAEQKTSSTFCRYMCSTE